MLKPPDNPKINDNRNYVYDESFYVRPEFPIIAEWVPENSRIIDLGCGNCSLIKYILEKKKIYAEGIDISESGINVCLKNGFKAKVGYIDKEETYKDYRDNEFDYAICNVTIQMIMYPEILLREMKRIAKYQIISFPNFAFIINRLDLLLLGRMPKFTLGGYEWYNTGHIHQLSIRDFKALANKIGLKIIKEHHLGKAGKLIKLCPNLLSQIAIFLCSK